MSEKIKARLPFGPEDPWYEFVSVYKSLPLRETTLGKSKEIQGHSSLITQGVLITSTFSEGREVGRVSFPRVAAVLISAELREKLAGWGWEFLLQGASRSVFRKSLPLINGESTLPMALPLILEQLGVDPSQDWLG